MRFVTAGFVHWLPKTTDKNVAEMFSRRFQGKETSLTSSRPPRPPAGQKWTVSSGDAWISSRGIIIGHFDEIPQSETLKCTHMTNGLELIFVA